MPRQLFLPLLLLAASLLHGQAVTLSGKPVEVFPADGSATTVLLFLRSDCPVSNLYAPEIARLHGEFAKQGARFWLVFPDNSDLATNVSQDVQQYYGGGLLARAAVRDPQHALVKAAGAKMMPEAAVFRGHTLVYEGRIDDRVAGIGQYRAQAAEHDLANAIAASLEDKPAVAAGGPAYGCYIADAE